MNYKQKDKLAMYDAVILFLTTYNTIWSANITMTGFVNKLKNNVLTIRN